ncbi:type IV pilus secretin PilQ [Oceanospirillum sediminis]|uniref:Type IV pilus secretin PilQ n=1 Tax=Oceanospirillum sediminis TaxID=2760088 RepID=A0A839ITF8_9GAMM|nr:type IV pilus secretin PilQ [Oceanospirillum sediminis]MBB1487934.1 type IV pilus secretin PilQ [Oceanospirillum sediminis]
MTLNFQKVDIRAAIRLVTENTGLNLVISDQVKGHITLYLEQVSWKKALALILQSQSLTYQKDGNILLITLEEEIIRQEHSELKHKAEREKLEALQSEYIDIHYAKASDLATLLRASDQQTSILSDRGQVRSDNRTNTLMIKDTPAVLQEVRELVSILDRPVQQVLIEARVVTSRTNISDELGIRWGGISNAHPDSSSLKLANGPLSVDLGVKGSGYMNYSPIAGRLALGYTSSDILVDLELAALASEGKSEIISQPKIIATNKKKALIKSGKQIAYQEESSSGGTKTAFKDALLLLEVTPQITPDHRIIMDLRINQDNPGSQEFSGVPSIDTNGLETQVVIRDGQTIVLGGIYSSSSFYQNFSVPVLGDLPLLGNLFRHSEKSQEKVELLVFITPRLIESTLSSPN